MCMTDPELDAEHGSNFLALLPELWLEGKETCALHIAAEDIPVVRYILFEILVSN